MAEEVKLPQLGESVTEGTITAWLIEEGEEIKEDEPLFEISTDKIDTEVPSPATGVLKEIRAQVDETVEVGAVVAIIDTDGEAAAEEPSEEAPAEEPPEEEEEEEEEEEAAAEEAEDAAEEAATEAGAPEETAEAAEEAEPAEETAAEETEEPATDEAEERDEAEPAREPSGDAGPMSPIVRKLIREHDLDPSRIEGTGQQGRITREDVQKAIEEGGAEREEQAAEPAAEQQRAAPTGRKPHDSVRGRTEKLPRVRTAIARSMWQSLQTTAQLTAAREVDVTEIMRLRNRVKDDFQQREGVSLSPLPFLSRAVCMVLPRHEALNASIDIEGGVAKYYDTINLGIAVDAPQGLIVPNVKDAQDKTVPALAREIADIAERTRNKKITPDDVQGGTFTITNTGSRGVLFDTPVLNPPETGILATPTIEKRPVVVSKDGSDAIAIRYMTYLCLTYDHRMVDGADAARFLADLEEIIETHDWAAEVGAT